MKTSESIKELATALSKAQAVMAGAKKDRENPHFKSKFADLSSVWDACREALTANGLSVVQMTAESEKDEIIVETRVMHSSGEWIEGRLALPVSKADAQGYGSALTYARRYGLSAAVGIAPEDDDGNLASAARPALPKAIPANIEGLEVFQKLDATTKDYLDQQAKSIIGLFNSKGDMAGYIKAQEYTTETELALWTLLPSLVRTAVKKQQAERRSLAEQA